MLDWKINQLTVTNILYMNLFKKLFIGIAIGVVVFAGVSFGMQQFQKQGSDAKAAQPEPICTNRTVGNTATYNPFTPLEFGVPNPTLANQTCRDIPLLNHFNPILGSVVPARDITLTNGGSTAVEVYYNNGANPTTGTAITNPMVNLDVTRTGNTYTIKGNLKGGNANLSSSSANAGGDLTINVPAGMKLAYRGDTTRWFPQAIVRKDLQATTGNTPDDAVADNSINGVTSNPIFSSFAGYTIPTSTGINLSYADTNLDAVRDANSPNTLPAGFLNYGYVLLNLYVTADNLPPALPNQVITITQGGSGDFKSYTTDPTFKGTDPGNNIPLTFTTGTLTGLNGVNCTNNTTTGVITCTADANAPLTPDRTFTVTPRNSLNIAGSPATYTVKIVASPTPKLGLVKSANPASGSNVTPGQTITYTLNYTNTGNGAANNVVITDVLDSKLSIVESSCIQSQGCAIDYGLCVPEGSCPPNKIIFTIGTVNANSSGSKTFQVTVKSGATGTISNKATISATGITPVDSNIVTHVIVAPATPNLTIVKSANPASGSQVNTGSTITYTLAVQNSGQGNAAGVVITDVLDSKITYVANSCTPAAACTYNATNRTLTWNIGAVNAGASITGTFRATVNTGATGTISNKATISATGITPIDSNTVTHTITTPQSPALAITKSSSPVSGSNVTVGQVINYTLNFSNTGGGNATGVTITDVLDSKLTFVANSCAPTAACAYDATTRTLTWTIGNIASGATGTGSFRATVNTGATGNILNSATIDSTETQPVTSNVVTLIIANPLTITKSASVTQVNPGGSITYTLNYRNTGSTNLTNVVIKDVIDSKTTYIVNSCAISTGTCAYTDTNKTLTVTIGNLAAGATGSFQFQVAANAGTSGTILNTAIITSTETGPINSNQVQVVINGGTVIPITPNLNITKTVSKNIVNPNDIVTYTINYSNTGSVAATNVVVTDLLNTELRIYTRNADGTISDKTINPLSYIDGSCNPSTGCVYNSSTKTLTFTLSTLAAGTSGSFNFQAKVSADAAGTIPNTASIKSTETPNPISSTVTITVQTTNNGLSIAKTASNTTFNPGSTITYSIVYANNTGKDATNVIVTDALDSKLTYVDGSCSPSNQCSFDSTSKTITWRIGTLADKATGTASFQAKVNNDATGTIPNTGSIKSDQNPTPVNSTVTVTISGNIQAQLVITPKVININRGPVDLRVNNIVDGNNKPLANANCKIDLTLPDGTTAQVLTTSDSSGVCAATIGANGGIFSTTGFPPASGSGNVNKLTAILGTIRGVATVTSGTQSTTTNNDQYTVIDQTTQTVTTRSGGFEIITAATSGIVAMLGYLYYTNFTNKQGVNFTPKRSKESNGN